MLIKKNFVKIAEILNDTLTAERDKNNKLKDNYYHFLGELLLIKLSNYFKSENPNFKEDVFKEAVLK